MRSAVTTARFPAWLRGRAAAENITLDDAAVDALAQQTEGNLLAAVQELRKLSLAGYSRRSAQPRCWPAARRAAVSMSRSWAKPCCWAIRARALRVLAGAARRGRGAHADPVVGLAGAAHGVAGAGARRAGERDLVAQPQSLAHGRGATPAAGARLLRAPQRARGRSGPHHQGQSTGQRLGCAGTAGGGVCVAAHRAAGGG